jgi:hypothetical protein
MRSPHHLPRLSCPHRRTGQRTGSPSVRGRAPQPLLRDVWRQRCIRIDRAGLVGPRPPGEMSSLSRQDSTETAWTLSGPLLIGTVELIPAATGAIRRLNRWEECAYGLSVLLIWAGATSIVAAVFVKSFQHRFLTTARGSLLHVHCGGHWRACAATTRTTSLSCPGALRSRSFRLAARSARWEACSPTSFSPHRSRSAPSLWPLWRHSGLPCSSLVSGLSPRVGRQ